MQKVSPKNSLPLLRKPKKPKWYRSVITSMAMFTWKSKSI